VTEIDIKERVL